MCPISGVHFVSEGCCRVAVLVHCLLIERETNLVQMEEWICGDGGGNSTFQIINLSARVTGMRYWTEEWRFGKCAVYAAT